jgi:phospholipid N-methyltransferase
MSKVPNSKLASIKKWIEPYNIFGEVFKILNNITVFCQHSQKQETAEKKCQIDQHTKSFLHEKCLNKSFSKQTFVYEASTFKENQSQVFKELCNTLIFSNIPLHKIKNKNFKSFLENTQFNIRVYQMKVRKKKKYI